MPSSVANHYRRRFFRLLLGDSDRAKPLRIVQLEMRKPEASKTCTS
jgi:hypothetical protein